jgi:hypothetical protein
MTFLIVTSIFILALLILNIKLWGDKFKNKVHQFKYQVTFRLNLLILIIFGSIGVYLSLGMP